MFLSVRLGWSLVGSYKEFSFGFLGLKAKCFDFNPASWTKLSEIFVEPIGHSLNKYISSAAVLQKTTAFSEGR